MPTYNGRMAPAMLYDAITGTTCTFPQLNFAISSGTNISSPRINVLVLRIYNTLEHTYESIEQIINFCFYINACKSENAVLTLDL